MMVDHGLESHLKVLLESRLMVLVFTDLLDRLTSRCALGQAYTRI